ncbi:unnamed protein product [Phytomonas sp. Hart1]|nr:unnamed protein product [Phytomonas sp. Hart1]|eukprot:CCW66916.1 unnamed protein product [Phytomonas sp. isolate Hart1]
MVSPLTSYLIWLLLCTLCVLGLGLDVSAHEIKDFDKVLIHVLHRHGARMPVDIPNQTNFCDEAPCGELTKNGARMLEEAGKYLSKEYTNGPNPLFPILANPSKSDTDYIESKPEYNLHDVYSRSVDLNRMIQSADSFLKGFFKNTPGTPCTPAIHTVPIPMDTVLATFLQPNLGFYYMHHPVTLSNAANPTTDTLFPDWRDLRKIAKQLGLNKICDSEVNRTECAFSLFDIAASMNSNGKINRYPLLEANYEKLKQITRAVYRFESYFDYDDEQRRLEGSRGYIYWKHVLKSI